MATNIAVMLFRQAVGVVIAIFATRWLLQLLGNTEFGVLMALGASGGLVTAISGSLSTACQRHLAYEIGKDDSDRLITLFNTSISIFSILAILLTIVGALIQPLIFSALSCPPTRVDAAKIVYLFVLAQIFFAVLVAPFRAFLIANQSMARVAALQIGMAVVDLILIVSLFRLDVDPLVYYSAGTTIIRGLVLAAMFLFCRHILTLPVRPFHFEKQDAKRIFSFASWSSLGHLVLNLRAHVSNLILNFIFGANVNAAFSIANRATSFLNTTQQSVLIATRPALTVAVAKGEQASSKKLMIFSGKVPYFVTFPVYAVMMLCAEDLLRLWLADYPDFAPIFLRILATALMVQVASKSYALALNALGTIAGITMLTFVTHIISVLLVLAGFYFYSWPPWALPTSQVVAVFLLSIAIAFFFAERCRLSVSQWVSNVIFPQLLVSLATFMPLIAIQASVHNRNWSLGLILFCSVTIGGLSSYFLGLNAEERRRVKGLLKRSRASLDSQPNQDV